MSNTGRTTAVAQGKAPATQASSRTAAAGAAESLTAPPPPVEQDTRIDVDDGLPPDNDKSEDETVQII